MFKKYPFVKQEGITDCGAASLLMILKYYQGLVSLNKMREITCTNQTGTTAYNLIKAAEQLGFRAKGYKCEIEKLAKLTKPLIAHVIIENSYQHYLVIYQINFKKNNIIIADPATKIKKISLNEFNLIWTGVVVEFKPKKTIVKYFNEKSFSIFTLINIIKKEAKYMIPLAIFVTFFSIINTYYFKFMIDGLIDHHPKNFYLLILISFLFINLLKIITDYYKNKILIILKQKIDKAISQITFHNIISLPYKYYCSRTTGEIISRINDLTIVKNMIATVLFVVFIDIPITLITIIFLLKLSKELFLISLIIYLLFFMLIFFRKLYQKYIDQIQTKRASLNSNLVELISNFETIKGLGIEKKTIHNIEKQQFNLLNMIRDFDQVQNVQSILKQIVSSIGFLIIIYLGALLVIEEKITIGTLLTFNTLLAYFLEPIKNIIEIDIEYQQTKNAFKRIQELFYQEKEIGYASPKLSGQINIKNLSYSYNKYDYVLKNLNLKIKKGEKVLIYGDSGCGKSTFLKLLMRFFLVKRGMVQYDDWDINDLKKKSIHDNITYISQSENLFNETVYQNLIKANKKSKVNIMLKICKIDQFLDRELGLNMMIEENGHNLSGGQKQRIILGRSLLKPAQIILIDEAFSELDVTLEKEILTNVFDKFKNKTIIVISHRLDNNYLYDKVYQFAKGTIASG